MNLYKQPLFQKLMLAFAITSLGDWFDFFALQIIFLYHLHATPLQIGYLIICYLAPMALFGIFVGVFVDRFRKLPMLIVIEFLCGFLTLGILFSETMGLALLLIFIRGIIASAGSPALMASIRLNVPEENLLQASSIQTIIFQAGRLFGPLVGAVVVAMSSAYMCLLINAISFFIAGFILLFTLYTKHIVDKASDKIADKNFLQEWKEGLQQILQSKILLVSFSSLLIMLAVVIIVESQLVYILKILVPQQQNILGYYLAVSAGCGVLFGMIFSKYKSIERPILYFAIGAALQTVGYGLLAFYNDAMPLFLLFIAAGLQGIGLILFSIVFRFVVQKVSAKDKIGRVSSLSAASQGVVMLLGSLLAGIILNVNDMHSVLMTLGGFLFIFTVILAIFNTRFTLPS